jgi:hypothetical protein
MMVTVAKAVAAAAPLAAAQLQSINCPGKLHLKATNVKQYNTSHSSQQDWSYISHAAGFWQYQRR